MTEVLTEKEAETFGGKKDTSKISGRIGTEKAGNAVKESKVKKGKKEKADSSAEAETLSPKKARKLAEGLVNVGFVFPWGQVAKKLDGKLDEKSRSEGASFALNEDETKLLVGSFSAILETVDVNKWAKYTPWLSMVATTSIVMLPRVAMVFSIKAKDRKGKTVVNRTSELGKKADNDNNNGNIR